MFAARMLLKNLETCLSSMCRCPACRCAVSNTPCPRCAMWSSIGSTIAAGSVVMQSVQEE